LLVILLALASGASAGWKEKVLYSFQGIPDGQYPENGVVFDNHGNLYGTTTYGGSDSCPGITPCGIVFQLQPGNSWTETVLYTFLGRDYNDGQTPAGGLIFDKAGNLYGTTAYGGSGTCTLLGTRPGCGTVFELSPPTGTGGAWTETVLYSFQGGNDGDFPQGDLAFDKAGNLYGATAFGGGYGSCNEYYPYCGTVFELSPPKTKGRAWTEQVLHAFTGGAGGAYPNGGLVLDRQGAVYGTAAIGGSGCGTLFKLVAEDGTWSEEVLHSFTDGADGSEPNGGLIFDAKGRLYGTTGAGGAAGHGLVYRLAPGRPWDETVLYNFTGGDDGKNPLAGVTFGSAGSLSGTTAYGGGGSGNAFRLKPPGGKGGAWNCTDLHGFTGPPDGEFPTARVIFDTAGNLYSTTRVGGTGTCNGGGCGTVFEVSP
jgi:uncharacterized repeat protein (TIGR03803 family)